MFGQICPHDKNTCSFSRWIWRWAMKPFFHLLDLTILNIFISLVSSGSKLSLQKFRLTLARDLIQETRRVPWPQTERQKRQTPSTSQLTLQRGVTSTACHAALSHSFDCISTTKGENVIGLLFTCSWRIWLSYGVGDSSYILLHFFLSSRSLGFLFAVPNFTAGFIRLWNKEMKYETNVIAVIT